MNSLCILGDSQKRYKYDAGLAEKVNKDPTQLKDTQIKEYSFQIWKIEGECAILAEMERGNKKIADIMCEYPTPKMPFYAAGHTPSNILAFLDGRVYPSLKYCLGAGAPWSDYINKTITGSPVTKENIRSFPGYQNYSGKGKILGTSDFFSAQRNAGSTLLDYIMNENFALIEVVENFGDAELLLSKGFEKTGIFTFENSTGELYVWSNPNFKHGGKKKK